MRLFPNKSRTEKITQKGFQKPFTKINAAAASCYASQKDEVRSIRPVQRKISVVQCLKIRPLLSEHSLPHKISCASLPCNEITGSATFLRPASAVKLVAKAHILSCSWFYKFFFTANPLNKENIINNKTCYLNFNNTAPPIYNNFANWSSIVTGLSSNKKPLLPAPQFEIESSTDVTTALVMCYFCCTHSWVLASFSKRLNLLVKN